MKKVLSPRAHLLQVTISHSENKSRPLIRKEMKMIKQFLLNVYQLQPGELLFRYLGGLNVHILYIRA